MKRASCMRRLAVALAVAAAGATSAQPAPAEPTQFDDLARCAIEKHTNEARWLGALLAKRVSVDPEVGGGAFLMFAAERGSVMLPSEGGLRKCAFIQADGTFADA